MGSSPSPRAGRRRGTTTARSSTSTTTAGAPAGSTPATGGGRPGRGQRGGAPGCGAARALPPGTAGRGRGGGVLSLLAGGLRDPQASPALVGLGFQPCLPSRAWDGRLVLSLPRPQTNLPWRAGGQGSFVCVCWGGGDSSNPKRDLKRVVQPQRLPPALQTGFAFLFRSPDICFNTLSSLRDWERIDWHLSLAQKSSGFTTGISFASAASRLGSISVVPKSQSSQNRNKTPNNLEMTLCLYGLRLAELSMKVWACVSLLK